jgi:hypothetical protein
MKNLSIPDKNQILGQLGYTPGQQENGEYQLINFCKLALAGKWATLKTSIVLRSKTEITQLAINLLIENAVLADALRTDLQAQIKANETAAKNEF